MFDDKCLFVFLGCRKRSGKDTVADIVRDHYYLKRKNIPEVHTYKLSCIQYARQAMKDLVPEMIDGSGKDENLVNGRNYRETIIGMVDPFLKVDELCFSKNLLKHCDGILKEIRGYTDALQVFLVPDLRRKSEADFFKEQLGTKSIMVLVNRDTTIPDPSAYAEGSLDDYKWDLVINNNSCLENLHDSTYSLINMIDGRINS